MLNYCLSPAELQCLTYAQCWTIFSILIFSHRTLYNQTSIQLRRRLCHNLGPSFIFTSNHLLCTARPTAEELATLMILSSSCEKIRAIPQCRKSNWIFCVEYSQAAASLSDENCWAKGYFFNSSSVSPNLIICRNGKNKTLQLMIWFLRGAHVYQQKPSDQ